MKNDKIKIMNNSNIKAVLFDFDRTLIRLYPSPEPLWELRHRIVKLFSPFGEIPIVDKDGYHAWHELHRWAWENLSQSDASNLTRKAEEMVAAYEIERVRSTRFFEGVELVLSRLSSSVLVGIVSSNSTKALRIAVNNTDIGKSLSYIAGRPDHPFDPNDLKPSPRPLLMASEILAIPPKDIAYVGDDVIDMRSAKSAKMIPLGVATGNYSKNDLDAAGAAMSFTGLLELADWL